MARAVIDLSSSIGQYLPHIARILKKADYFPRSGSITLYEQKLYIEIKAKTITVYYAEDEAQARSVIERLKTTLESTY